jgi:hypothetical protein
VVHFEVRIGDATGSRPYRLRGSKHRLSAAWWAMKDSAIGEPIRDGRTRLRDGRALAYAE